MSDASNYPVEQRYGYDPSYPTADHFHKGIDYGAPEGTPVLVNGVQIGLVGHTGFAYDNEGKNSVKAAHLHVGKWIGGQHYDPGVGNGFHFGSATVTQVASDSVNGNFVRVQADGASWVYLHLAAQTCHVGQVLTPPAPAPASPPPIVRPYTIENITPKEVQLTRDTHKWGLNYDNFTAINSHPEGNVGVNTVITVRAILHHNIGYTYYLEDPNNASGYNVVDCVDYNPTAPTPPPPPEPAPAPYVPPAAPVPIPLARKYTLENDVAAYNTATDAGNHVGRRGTVVAGSYFVYNEYSGKPNLLNLTLSNGKAGAWINTEEDVAPKSPQPKVLTAAEKEAITKSWDEATKPDPTPVKEVKPEPAPPEPDTENTVRMNIQWFMPDHSAIECEVLKPIMATEAFSKRGPIELKKGNEYRVFATFTKDGRHYALLRLGNDTHFEYLYGVPVNSHFDVGPYLNDIYSVADKIRYGFEKTYSNIHKTIQGIFFPKHKK